MVLATQTLLQRDPKTYEVRVDGRLAPGVSAKDIILALIARIGIGGGTGHVFEYTGEAIRGADHGAADDRLQHEHRGRRAGRADRPGRHDLRVPARPGATPRPGPPGTPRSTRWRALPTDDGATYDKTDHHRRRRARADGHLRHEPGHGHPDHQPRPLARPTRPTRASAAPSSARSSTWTSSPARRSSARRSMSSSSGAARTAGSATCGSRPSVLKDRHVADGVRLMVVPGSDEVKREAEAEGLSEIFKAAGAEWREAGCSMCIAMNGDQLRPGQYAVSTSNRNFEGRQGKGGRTFLASPLTAAASAIAGVVADPRRLPGHRDAGRRRGPLTAWPSRSPCSPAGSSRSRPRTSTPTRSSRPATSR